MENLNIKTILLSLFLFITMSVVASPIVLVKVIDVKTPRLNAQPSDYARTNSSSARSKIVDVTWNPKHSVFRADVSYTVTVGLRATRGETFSTSLRNNKNGGATINGKKAKVVSFSPSHITIQYTYPPLRYNSNNRPTQKIEITNVSIYDVMEPYVGDRQSTKSLKLNSNSCFIERSSWYPSSSLFKENVSYVFRATIKAKNNSYFSSRLRKNSNGGLTVNGRKAKVVTLTDYSMTIEYIYPRLQPIRRNNNARITR